MESISAKVIDKYIMDAVAACDHFDFHLVLHEANEENDDRYMSVKGGAVNICKFSGLLEYMAMQCANSTVTVEELDTGGTSINGTFFSHSLSRKAYEHTRLSFTEVAFMRIGHLYELFETYIEETADGGFDGEDCATVASLLSVLRKFLLGAAGDEDVFYLITMYDKDGKVLNCFDESMESYADNFLNYRAMTDDN